MIFQSTRRLSEAQSTYHYDGTNIVLFVTDQLCAIPESYESEQVIEFEDLLN